MVGETKHEGSVALTREEFQNLTDIWYGLEAIIKLLDDSGNDEYWKVSSVLKPLGRMFSRVMQELTSQELTSRGTDAKNAEVDE